MRPKGFEIQYSRSPGQALLSVMTGVVSDHIQYVREADVGTVASSQANENVSPTEKICKLVGRRSHEALVITIES